MLHVYNSMAKTKEPFKPLNDKQVKLYVCGVTVYDYCHLGHARTYVAFDVIIRFLRSQGYDVTYVRNITDIDDKIIKRAQESNKDFQAIVSEFTAAMHEDFAALGLAKPDHEPRATDSIHSIIALIEKLIENGSAYVAANGDVYFEVRKFAKYGCLAHRDIDKLESGARVEVNDVKRDPLDFVLWKLAKPGEPKWDSPWGEGRPGWHIECSAMSMDILGESFDMHGGGKDLIFPHHENEIAQSEAVTHKPFVNYWLHAGFLQINKEKMSKSLGNFFTIRDLLQDHTPEVLRYFLISSHYRSPLQFSDENLLQARSSLERLYTALRNLPLEEASTDSEYEANFIAAMNDDFNTPIALSELFQLAHQIQKLRETDVVKASQLAGLLRKLGGILGILQEDATEFLQSGNAEVDATKVEALIAARNAARSAKDWAQADKIRKELSSMSVVLEDTATGTTWRVE